MEKTSEISPIMEMPKRIPTNGTFELTIRCNLSCKMCMFRHNDRENSTLISKELTTEQWIDIAKQVAEAGTMSLLITGGEPMLRPDFCKIWEEIYKFGFVITLYTNATLVTPQVMETLQKYPPHIIGVTIYGASPETYAKVCGNSAAFQKMLDGIHQLQSLPSVIEFRATLIKDNYCDAKLIDELVKKEFGTNYGVKQASPVNKAVRGAYADVESCRIPPEQDIQMKIRRLEESICQMLGSDFDPKNLVMKENSNGIIPDCDSDMRYSLFGCQAGISQYTITYDGKLLACQMIDVFFTDVLRSGFQKAWKSFPSQVQIPDTKIKCENCPYKENCQSCYASRYAETGNFNGCSDYIYRMAKARKQYQIFQEEIK